MERDWEEMDCLYLGYLYSAISIYVYDMNTSGNLCIHIKKCIFVDNIRVKNVSCGKEYND